MSWVAPGIAPTLAWTNRLAQDGTIAVVTSVAMNPTNINVAIAGNSLVLSWPEDHIGWRLQTQTNAVSVGLSTNWLDVTGAETTNWITIPITPEEVSVFFRLKLP